MKQLRLASDNAKVVTGHMLRGTTFYVNGEGGGILSPAARNLTSNCGS